MSVPVFAIPTAHLVRLGLKITDSLHYQLEPHELIRHALRRKEGVLNDTGALVVKTGAFTGRSPKDRYIAKDEHTAGTIHWNDFNQPIAENYFDHIFSAITNYLNNLPEVFVRDCYVCADQRFRLNIRVINELASTNLFAYNMFLRPTQEDLEKFLPALQILSSPNRLLDTTHSGTTNPNAVVLSFRRKRI